MSFVEPENQRDDDKYKLDRISLVEVDFESSEVA